MDFLAALFLSQKVHPAPPVLFIPAQQSAEAQTCTGDARLFRPALYYLSYLGNITENINQFSQLRHVQIFSRRSFRGHYRASFRAQRELSEHGIPSEAPIFEKLAHGVNLNNLSIAR